MNPPEQQYDRMAEIEEEIWAIVGDKAPEKTIIGGEEFDNMAWLEAERAALEAEQERIEETVTINGEFAGLAQE